MFIFATKDETQAGLQLNKQGRNPKPEEHFACRVSVKQQMSSELLKPPQHPGRPSLIGLAPLHPAGQSLKVTHTFFSCRKGSAGGIDFSFSSEVVSEKEQIKYLFNSALYMIVETSNTICGALCKTKCRYSLSKIFRNS